MVVNRLKIFILQFDKTSKFLFFVVADEFKFAFTGSRVLKAAINTDHMIQRGRRERKTDLTSPETKYQVKVRNRQTCFEYGGSCHVRV